MKRKTPILYTIVRSSERTIPC